MSWLLSQDTLDREKFSDGVKRNKSFKRLRLTMVVLVLSVHTKNSYRTIEAFPFLVFINSEP